MVKQKRKNNRLILLGLILGLFCIAGGSITYWLLMSRRPVEGVPVGSNVIPADAMMAFSLTTDQRQWEKLQKFGTPASQTAFNQLWSGWQDRLFTKNGINYQSDIQPWVGKEGMIAVLRKENLEANQPVDPNTPPPPPTQVAIVGIFPIADFNKAQAIFANPKQPTQGQLTKRNYKGVEVLQTEGASPQNYQMTLLGKEYLIVSDAPEGINRVIDTFKGAGSLAKSEGYADSLKTIETPNPLAELYVNIPLAATYASANSTRPIPPDRLTKLSEHQGWASSLNLINSGLEFKGISWLKPNSEKKIAVDNNAKAILERIPDNTYLLISGSNLKNVWQDYTTGADANPLAPINPDALRQAVQNGLGVNLDKDLIPWMGGEFALGLIPANIPAEKLPKFTAGFVLLVKTSDRRLAEQNLTNLDENMKKKEFQVSETTINGTKVMQWLSKFGGYTITRGWLDGNIAFFSIGAPEVVNQIIPTPKVPLAGSQLFKDSMPLKDLDNFNGNFYLDVTRVFDPKNLSLPQLPPAQKVWVDGIDSIGLTSIVNSNRSVRYDGIVRLKSGKN